MFVYGLRLLVALITFGVGVAASWLTSSACPTRQQNRVRAAEQVYVLQASDAFPPPASMGTRECKSGLAKAEHGPVEMVEGGFLNGRAERLPAAVYPPAARETGVRGTVYVRVVLNESGRVASARAIAGPEVFHQAAVDAALQARFAPTLLSGQARKVSGTIGYNFSPK